jgi:hypothetical protein
MIRRGDLEALLSLAMLPVGAVLAVGSALALLPLGVFALLLPFFGGRDWGWIEVWLIVAALVAVRNTVAALEALSALAWRPAIVVALIWGATALTFPGWWLARD